MATLDCGHENDWSALARVLDLSGPTTSLCKACANARELSALRVASKGFAYLSADNATITDWGGLTLATVIGPINKTAPKPGRRIAPNAVWTFRAKMATGEVFACRHWPDSGTYVRLTRVKGA